MHDTHRAARGIPRRRRNSKLAARQGLEPFVHQDEQLALLEAWRGPQAFRAWLKIDSGMHRLGFAPGQAATAIARLRACRFVAQPLRDRDPSRRCRARGTVSDARAARGFRDRDRGPFRRAKHRELGRAHRLAGGPCGLGAARHHALRHLAVRRTDRRRPRASSRHVPGDRASSRSRISPPAIASAMAARGPRLAPRALRSLPSVMATAIRAAPATARRLP